MSPLLSTSDLPVGGFFGQEPPGQGGLADLWGVTAALAWENAGSAFAALVAHLQPEAVWMPGYLCTHMTAAVPAPARRFFGLNTAMTPDLRAFSGLRRGDLVLAVNYFGREPGPGWRAFVASRPDVTFVEDCAQSLDSGPAWGDWRLYSPRKLFGVAEGGLLAPTSPRAVADFGPGLPADPQRAEARRLPVLLRAKRPADNALWHPLHQAAEAAGEVSARAMDGQAFDLLASIDPAPAIAARQANFAQLARYLGDHALIRDTDPPFAPFGFPVLLPPAQRDTVLHRLHGQGVFAAVHWRDIAAPRAFAADHARAASLITLPCDHRYGAPEMDRVIQAFESAVT